MCGCGGWRFVGVADVFDVSGFLLFLRILDYLYVWVLNVNGMEFWIGF